MRLTSIVTTIFALFLTALPLNAAAQKEKSAKPKLIVAISVDQLSSDLFAEYRATFTGGLKKLMEGAVFPSGYQSHAATETCPGHATLMTGVHPARAGIIGNQWYDLNTKRADKRIYCAEDESAEGSTSRSYVASAKHLLVPTLGERLKVANPKSINIAVAGKDRSALMMGGNNIDHAYWWKSKELVTLKGRDMHPAIAPSNARLAKKIASGAPAIEAPAHCAARTAALQLSESYKVGDYAFARPPNKPRFMAASPHVDEELLRASLALIRAESLGRDDVVDIASIGLAGTDYVGHAFGTEGLEMCIQMAALDEILARFFNELDRDGLDYMVVLTADHGGHDVPERLKLQGVPNAQRADAALLADNMDKAIKEKLKITREEPVIYSLGPFGDYYVSNTLDQAQWDAVFGEAKRFFENHSQVAAVFSKKEIGDLTMPTGPVQNWSIAERARASFHPARSGDLLLYLKPAVTPIPGIRPGIVATHGSAWDYDRRVPMLFWRKGARGFEQPVPVRTVDIAPTLSALIGLDVKAGEFDGRCLDLDAGAGSTCD